jgi:ubiquinone/menaquinone biosynthesis C-methylase UbiE
MEVTLSHADARAVYDRIGAWLDTQRFYEDGPVTELIAHADFGVARSVFEFGVGTGRVAARLLRDHLPPGARYHGIDVSPTMVALARQRLAPWLERATVALSDGSPRPDAPAATFDRFLSTFVFDLLAVNDIRVALEEARRLLTPNGRLCLVSLTGGRTLMERLVMGAAGGLHKLSPQLVGGCRAIDLAAFLSGELWHVTHRHVVSRWGVPSEVVVATPARGAR